MRNLLISAAAFAAMTMFAPAPTFAQGVTIDTPAGGVRVGEPRRDEDRYDHRRWREREVRGGCRTITIQRDDGSYRRIRKCDY
jgi:hypothetical protein